MRLRGLQKERVHVNVRKRNLVGQDRLAWAWSASLFFGGVVEGCGVCEGSCENAA